MTHSIPAPACRVRAAPRPFPCLSRHRFQALLESGIGADELSEISAVVESCGGSGRDRGLRERPGAREHDRIIDESGSTRRVRRADDGFQRRTFLGGDRIAMLIERILGAPETAEVALRAEPPPTSPRPNPRGRLRLTVRRPARSRWRLRSPHGGACVQGTARESRRDR